jgi:hypothetical protein
VAVNSNTSDHKTGHAKGLQAALGALAALAAAAALLAVFPIWAAVAGKPAHTSCVAAPAASTVSTKAKPAKLVLINAQATTLAFNRALTTKTLIVQYGISGTIYEYLKHPYLRVITQGFLRNDQAVLPPGRIQAAAQYQDGRVLLSLCVDRSGGKLADPGTYQGTVSIVDQRVGRVDVPITVTLAYPSWQLVLELLVLASIGGTWYIWVLQQKKPLALPFGAEFLRYCISMIGVLSIAAGVIAALGVYSATYLSSVDWGSSATQPLALLGAMFGAFLAGASSVHIGAAAGKAQVAQKRQKKTANVGASTPDEPQAAGPQPGEPAADQHGP